MKIAFAIIGLLLVLGVGSAQESSTLGDDNPRIDETEIVRESIDSGDAEWIPPYKFYENPATIDCRERQECTANKSNATRSGTVNPK